MPTPLACFFIVPLVGNCSATPDGCSKTVALTTAHLQYFGEEQQSVAELLAKLGCWCIADRHAEFVSNLSIAQEPVTLALAAAAAGQSIPLQQLISQQHLGAATFRDIRTLMTKLIVGTCQRRVQEFLRQCSLFEDINGKQLNLSQQSEVKALPTLEWERKIAAMPDVFPWTAIKYHSVTSTQKQLLSMAGFEPIGLAKFVDVT